jgi:glycosyltransferase involved in cell wall biosynthesis
LPVVAYDVSGMEEILRDGRNGYAVRIQDVEALSVVVERLVRDDGHRRELAERAIAEFDESFSEDAMMRGITELYEELVDRAVGSGRLPDSRVRG